jgi:DNA-directed RNA polymerase subunit M/transcription elongation factor TFIIS
MEFCEKCDNMYYMMIGQADDQLMYYCRFCGNEKKDVRTTNLCVSSYEENPTPKISKINEYTEHDVTLKHNHTIKCPNQECTSNQGNKPDVIEMRIDDVNMKYQYLCTYCKTSWGY